MKLFRGVFGNRAEGFEEQADDLRIHSMPREAAYFYGRALEALRHDQEVARRRITLRLLEMRRLTFDLLLSEAEALVESGRSDAALEVLRDAEAFAVEVEDRGVLAGRIAALTGAVPAAGGAEADGPPEAPLDAMDHLEREVMTRPESASARERLARALEREGRYNEAVRHFESAYHRNPEDISLILDIARVLRDRLDDPVAARERLDQGCRRHRPSAASSALHLERAFALAEAGRDEEAIASLGTLLATPGIDAGVVLFNRAGFLEKAGRHEEAITDLEAAIAHAPSNLLYFERLADLLFRPEGDPERALVCLERALAADAHDFGVRRKAGASPDRARLQFKAARILFFLDHIDEARARVDQGLVVCWDPRVEEALLELRRELERDD
jgi:tetratricopeptide (TPR) repeat protein